MTSVIDPIHTSLHTRAQALPPKLQLPQVSPRGDLGCFGRRKFFVGSNEFLSRPKKLQTKKRRKIKQFE
jgi:hypothetical protein